MSLGVPHMGYIYLNVLDSPELLQIFVTLIAVIKPLLPKFLGRAIVILNFVALPGPLSFFLVRRLQNFIADSALIEKYNVILNCFKPPLRPLHPVVY